MNDKVLRDLSPTHAPELAAELLRAVDEERERVAREIHDELAQELFALRLLAEAVAESDGPDRADQARKVAELAARVEQTARELAHSYSSLSATGGKIGNAVRTLAQRHEGRATFDLSGLPEVHLGGSTAPHLHRIVQEAVTNAMRHGSATHILIALNTKSPLWQLIVEDNGSGFDPSQTPLGLGLQTMAYRAAQIGGSLRVEKNPGAGMRVICEFPPAS
jgi:two-component system NarL family sensor kinase